ncbi:hypothetical protein VIN01S_10030 [Vibrio inusitatus NBRC 102082]|uniref:Uncharacterized protein n=1 Tax=Vibrio inusitatus NBRC 102082 TaxID=1219070 RepID=A0A4Y3HSS5_9VIBR|nr:hypothetical protein [Vibrio inusitatus]GEA50199.1 hypothetical protein VIN01S_10030 [Vibrio inusitatus NBRC 102082]
MKVSKTAIAVALSSAFLFGCDFDVGSENSATGGGTGGGDTGGGTGGGDEIVPGANYFVQIQDNFVQGSGQLRVKLSESKSDTAVDNIPEGFLTVDLTYQDGVREDGRPETENAYIQIHTADASNSGLRGEVVLGGGKVKYRDPASGLTDAGGTYTEGEELKVKATWTTDSFSFTINDQEYGPFDVASTNPVENITLKVGDNSGKSNHEMLADNFKIYQGNESENELIFEDDFDAGYGNGHDLNGVRYNRAEDVMVISLGGENNPDEDNNDGAVDMPAGKYVALHDDNDEVNDAGELRYSLGTSERIHEQGKASVYIKNPSDQSAVFTVFGVDDQLKDVGQIISVRLREDGRVYHRPATSDTWTETGTTINASDWNKLSVDWDTNSGNNYNLYVNGNLIGEYERRITQANVSTRYVAVQVGTGNSDTITNGHTIDLDNLALYSDTAGKTALHMDDFEGFALGTDLGADPSTTEYDKSGYNAIVQE